MLALAFPTIDPVLIEFGPIAIRWYALSYIAGLLLGWFVAQKLVTRPQLFGATKFPSSVDFDDFLLWAMLGIVLGGRIGFVLFYNLEYYISEPHEIYKVWHGGMSFHGGMAGLMVAAYFFARTRNLSFLSLMDVVSTVAPIGLFFGRIANFINGELFGRYTDVPWAVLFPRGGFVPRHPSQLYEAALEGVVLLALLLTAVFKFRAYQKPGFIGALFLMGYGIARFIVEFYREPDAQLGFLYAGATMGQMLSLPMIVAGAGLVLVVIRRKSF